MKREDCTDPIELGDFPFKSLEGVPKVAGVFDVIRHHALPTEVGSVADLIARPTDEGDAQRWKSEIPQVLGLAAELLPNSHRDDAWLRAERMPFGSLLRLGRDGCETLG